MASLLHMSIFRAGAMVSTILAGLAGCAAIASLQDPSDEGTPPEAGAGDVIAEARVDDTGVDSTSEVDATGDGGTDARPSCAALEGQPGVLFCSDFEEPQSTTEPFGWSYSFAAPEAGLSISVGTPQGRTGRGARFVMAQGSGARTLSLRFASPKSITSATSVELSFSIRLVSTTQDYAALGTVFVYDASADATPVFFGADMKRLPPSTFGAVNGMSTVTATPGTWHDVVARLSRAQVGTAFAGTVTIDGTSSFTGNVQAQGTTEVWIGIYNVSFNTAATTVDFDDVVFRMLP